MEFFLSFFLSSFYLLRDAEALPGQTPTAIESNDTVHLLPDVRDILGELEVNVDLAVVRVPLDVVGTLRGDLNRCHDAVLVINLYKTRLRLSCPCFAAKVKGPLPWSKRRKT